MIFEVFHLAALVPLTVLAVGYARRTDRPPLLYWTVAWAMMVSWLADTLGAQLGPLWVAALWPPIQAGLVVLGVSRHGPREASWNAVAVVLGLFTLALIVQGPLQRPEAVVTILSHVAALAGVLWHLEGGALRRGLLVYFGLGVAWLAAWPILWGTAGFVTVYYGYQITRMLGLAVITWAMATYRPTRPVLAA